MDMQPLHNEEDQKLILMLTMKFNEAVALINDIIGYVPEYFLEKHKYMEQFNELYAMSEKLFDKAYKNE